MVTVQEIELLAEILQNRACITQIETLWLNNLLNRLRAQLAGGKRKEFSQPQKVDTTS